VLDMSMRGLELDDLARRVEELESLAKGGRDGGEPAPKT
jgi:hypothetical protein